MDMGFTERLNFKPLFYFLFCVSLFEIDLRGAKAPSSKEALEKGKISESLVYVRYWSRNWKGIGFQPPGG